MNYLKLVSLVFICGFLLSGCTSKEVISVKPYESKYAQESIDKTINLVSVNDKRETDIFATILYNEEEIKKYKSTVNLKNWFKDALEKDFSTSGIKTAQNASIQFEINIIKFDVKYIKDKSLDKNLFGKVELELIFKKGNTTKKKYIIAGNTAWKVTVSDAEDFEKFVYENLSDSVVNSVKFVVKTLKKSDI